MGFINESIREMTLSDASYGAGRRAANNIRHRNARTLRYELLLTFVAHDRPQSRSAHESSAQQGPYGQFVSNASWQLSPNFVDGAAGQAAAVRADRQALWR